MNQLEYDQLTAIREHLKEVIPTTEDLEQKAKFEDDLKDINEILLVENIRRYGEAISEKAR